MSEDEIKGISSRDLLIQLNVQYQFIKERLDLYNSMFKTIELDLNNIKSKDLNEIRNKASIDKEAIMLELRKVELTALQESKRMQVKMASLSSVVSIIIVLLITWIKNKLLQ